MDKSKELFPSSVRAHLGTWEGTFTFVDPRTWKQIDKHHSVINVGIRGGAYSQRNTYTWEDGRKQVKVFGGRAIDGCLEMENKALKGRAHSIGGNDLLFVAEMKGTNISVYEVIRMLGEDKRARIWQMSDGEKITAVVHIEEERISKDDVFFDVGDA